MAHLSAMRAFTLPIRVWRFRDTLDVFRFLKVLVPVVTANHIFADVDAKGLGQLLGNPPTAKAGIAPLEFTNDLNEFRCGPFWARLAFGTGGVEESIFALLEPTMKA
jgi:hypothetical protein